MKSTVLIRGIRRDAVDSGIIAGLETNGKVRVVNGSAGELCRSLTGARRPLSGSSFSQNGQFVFNYMEKQAGTPCGAGNSGEIVLCSSSVAVRLWHRAGSQRRPR
jgi:hypothetical protein